MIRDAIAADKNNSAAVHTPSLSDTQPRTASVTGKRPREFNLEWEMEAARRWFHDPDVLASFEAYLRKTFMPGS